MTDQDQVRVFWETWGPLYKRLRPEQATHLLACWPLFEAVAWGQVSLSEVFELDFGLTTPVSWKLGEDDPQVREFGRKVRALVRLLADRHPVLLRNLPRLVRALALFADVDLDPRLPLISAKAVDYRVPPSPCSLYQLLLTCEFGEYGPEVYHFPWHQVTNQVADQPLNVRLVQPKYESPLQIAAQVEDMGHSAAGLRAILRFVRNWRDLGEQELVVVSLDGARTDRFPMYSYQAGATKLAMLKAGQINWRAPTLRVLAINARQAPSA